MGIIPKFATLPLRTPLGGRLREAELDGAPTPTLQEGDILPGGGSFNTMGEHASKKLVRALLVPFDDDTIGLRGLLINKIQHKFTLDYNLCTLIDIVCIKTFL